MKYEIPIAPMGKPRMVKSDSWRKRPCVTRYWQFKDDLNHLCNQAGYRQGNELYAVFRIPIPESRKKGKNSLIPGQMHDQKFDVDNIIKAVLDCLLPSGDEKVHTVCVKKIWSDRPGIIFFDSFYDWVGA